MSMRSLESAILAEARIVLRNRKLRLKDIMEWRTGFVAPAHGEIVVFLPEHKVNVAVLACDDKRATAKEGDHG